MEENWGVGKEANAKAFQKVLIEGELVDLIFGEHPHSRQDNTKYARFSPNNIVGFDGHRLCMDIHIQEGNYLKSSSVSGDQVRKTCKGVLKVNGQKIYECSHRNYEACYKLINTFIAKMEEYWWFIDEKERETYIGRIVGYREQLFRIESFDVEYGSINLVTLDGEPRKMFLWENPEEDREEISNHVRCLIISEELTWFPRGLMRKDLHGPTLPEIKNK